MLLLSLAVAAGCGGSGGARGRVVAILDGRELSTVDLEAYFAVNLPADFARELSQDEENEVRSRLFDDFIRELLLYREARRLGVEVGDDEVRLYFRSDGEQDEPPPAPDEARIEAVRRLLAVQKFSQSYSGDGVEPTPEMIDAFVESERAVLQPGHFVVRSLLLSSPGDAQRLYGEILAGRLTFDEAATAHEDTAGRSVPLEVSPEALPAEVRRQLETLEPGGVSRPVELHGTSYVFQLVGRQAEGSAAESELRARAERELRRRRRGAALDRLKHRLRGAAALEIRRENLPFRYVPERRPEAPA